MAAKLVKTRTPGIFKRGGRYVFIYRVDGRQKWESARTLEEARRKKSEREADIDRGEFEEHSRVTFHEYAREWVKRYQGRGRRGFRENTRDEYERLLNQYVLAHFSERVKLTEITPVRVAGFIAWLCDADKQGHRAAEDRRRLKAAKLGVPAGGLPLSENDEHGKPLPITPLELGDSTVKNIVAPLRACLATAVKEGLIRSNPAREAELPHRPVVEAPAEEEIKAMSREELDTLLALLPDRWQLFFRFLASTGLRISEAIALQWRHLHLDGSRPHVKVRQGLVRGRLAPPKSKHGKRNVPLDHELALALRQLRRDTEWPDDEHFVFPAGNGSPLMPGNVRRRVLKPAAEEAGLPWVGFHTFRHTCASMLFAQGRNAVQVQRWLGHHSAAFTLSTYVHLLDGDIGEPLAIGSPGALQPVESANSVLTAPTTLGTEAPHGEAEDLAA
jgi:integrase